MRCDTAAEKAAKLSTILCSDEQKLHERYDGLLHLMHGFEYRALLPQFMPLTFETYDQLTATAHGRVVKAKENVFAFNLSPMASVEVRDDHSGYSYPIVRLRSRGQTLDMTPGQLMVFMHKYQAILLPGQGTTFCTCVHAFAFTFACVFVCMRLRHPMWPLCFPYLVTVAT